LPSELRPLTLCGTAHAPAEALLGAAVEFLAGLAGGGTRVLELAIGSAGWRFRDEGEFNQ
jgi:hypothetical protein